MTSPKCETPLEELARYAQRLAMTMKTVSGGNGTYDREYVIGEITLAISGWWGADSDDWNKEYDTHYWVELGNTEILDGDMGKPPTQRTADDALVMQVLEEVRRHVVLDRLADV